LSASCMHAALCRRRSAQPAGSEFANIIDSASDELIASISATGWAIDETLEELAGLAAYIGDNFQLVKRAATRRFGAGAADSDRVIRVAASVANFEAKLHAALPHLNDELRLRVGPIREQWEARGPGLLNEVVRLTEREFVPDGVDIVLVAPYLGGHGLAHWSTNRILLEAVLVNPTPELPESVRLAWLICQLNGDLPRYADLLPASAARRVVELAAMTATLSAAETVELARCDEASLSLAIEAWTIEPDSQKRLPLRLLQWWEARVESSVRWPVALAALRRILEE